MARIASTERLPMTALPRIVALDDVKLSRIRGDRPGLLQVPAEHTMVQVLRFFLLSFFRTRPPRRARRCT
eukprot:7419090-Heterocapsa_arctica.AAC.1